MRFIEEDWIFMENLYILKVMEQKNLFSNFWIKVGDYGVWTNVPKTCKKLARRQDEVAALKAYRIFLVFSVA